MYIHIGLLREVCVCYIESASDERESLIAGVGFNCEVRVWLGPPRFWGRVCSRQNYPSTQYAHTDRQIHSLERRGKTFLQHALALSPSGYHAYLCAVRLFLTAGPCPWLNSPSLSVNIICIYWVGSDESELRMQLTCKPNIKHPLSRRVFLRLWRKWSRVRND